MTTPSALPDLQSHTGFPQAEIEKSLRDELTVLVKQQAAVKGDTLPSETQAILAKTIHIDSLGVVEILCVLDGILPFQIDESVVRAGGYSSVQEAITDLVPKISNRWCKHQGRRRP